jgi:hypothetical protein
MPEAPEATIGANVDVPTDAIVVGVVGVTCGTQLCVRQRVDKAEPEEWRRADRDDPGTQGRWGGLSPRDAETRDTLEVRRSRNRGEPRCVGHIAAATHDRGVVAVDARDVVIIGPEPLRGRECVHKERAAPIERRPLRRCEISPRLTQLASSR